MVRHKVREELAHHALRFHIFARDEDCALS